MPMAVWLVLAGLVAALIVWRILMPSLDKVVDQAARDKDLADLIDAIGKRPEGAQPSAYNHSIRRLWDSYQRPLAAELVRDLAKNYGTKNITQYWIKQVLTVEPVLAKKTFSKDFLNTYYQPEVAAKCGQVG